MATTSKDQTPANDKTTPHPRAPLFQLSRAGLEEWAQQNQRACDFAAAQFAESMRLQRLLQGQALAASRAWLESVETVAARAGEPMGGPLPMGSFAQLFPFLRAAA